MARRSKFGRLLVWNQSSDAYKHTDLAYNLDQLDQMIGGPTQTPTHGIGNDFNNPTVSAPAPDNQWLYPQDPTTIANFGNRTLYNIVRALDYNSLPLGAVIPWWRPSIDVPLPFGAVVADGSSYTGAAQHSYTGFGLTTITVPDLRNKMVLGAYETATGASTVNLNRDGLAATSPATNTGTDGPGIGAIGGSNVARIVTHSHGAGSYALAHTHTVANHVHDMSHTHYVDHTHANPHYHRFDAITGTPSTASANFAAGGAGNAGARTHTHNLGGYTGDSLIPQTQGSTLPYISIAATTGGASPGTVAQDTAQVTGTSAPDSPVVDIQPRYYGLLYIVKIKRPGPLHDTTFPPGT